MTPAEYQSIRAAIEQLSARLGRLEARARDIDRRLDAPEDAPTLVGVQS